MNAEDEAEWERMKPYYEQALDRLVEAGWAARVVRSERSGTAVEFTPEGAEKMAALAALWVEAGGRSVGRDEWWVLLALARQHHPG